MSNSIKHRLSGFFRKFQYELSILFILGFEYIINVPTVDRMNYYNNTFYVFSYQYGFGSRFLMGSVVHILCRIFGTTLTSQFLWLFLCLCTMVMCILFAVYVGNVIKKSDGLTSDFAQYLTILFLASPASVSYLFRAINYGILDLFSLIFTLMILLIVKRPLLRWLIPLLCFFSIANHQVVGMFFHIPVIFIVLFYIIYDAYYTEKIYKKKNIVIIVASGVVSVLAFIYFQLFSRNTLKFISVEDLIDKVEPFFSGKISSSMVSWEYFSPLSEHIKSMIADYRSLLSSLFITLILLSPALILIACFWVKCFKRSNNIFLKGIFLLCFALPLASLPVYLLAYDWWRWLALNFIGQFLLIYFFIPQKQIHVIEVCSDYVFFIRKHKFLFFILIIYLTMLGKFDRQKYSIDVVEKIEMIIKHIL